MKSNLLKVLYRLIFSTLFFPLVANAQDPNVSVYVDHVSYSNAKTFEFDIMMKATGATSSFQLRTFQAGLYLNSAWINGGLLSFQNVSTYSEMSTPSYNGTFQWNSTDNLVNCSVNYDVKTPSSCVATTVTTAPMLVTRIRVTNTADFTCATPDIKFNYVSSTTPALKLKTSFSWRAVGCTTNFDMFYPGRTFTGSAVYNGETYTTGDADGKSPVIGTGNPGFCFHQLTLTAFLEGFVNVGSTPLMNASLLNSELAHATPEQADTITVELHSTAGAHALVASTKAILSTSGIAYCLFPSSVPLTQYWLVCKHRSAIETWSGSPITLSTRTSYDFSNAASKAFGDNMKFIGGKWSFFSGDISDAATGQLHPDGVMESQDYTDLSNAVFFTYIGYTPEDITGDGVVESADYITEANNVFITIVAATP